MFYFLYKKLKNKVERERVKNQTITIVLHP